jgi:hypothetical protein
MLAAMLSVNFAARKGGIEFWPRLFLALAAGTLVALLTFRVRGPRAQH